MRKWKVILVTLILIAVLTGCQANSQQQTQTEPKYIGMEQAQSNALLAAQIDAADASISSTTLENTNGITCYKVEFISDGSIYTYSVHAETGEIIEASFRDADIVDEAAGSQTQDVENEKTDASFNSENGEPETMDTAVMIPFEPLIRTSSSSMAEMHTGFADDAQSSTVKQQITENAAKDAALKHAGVKAADATFVKTKRDLDDGRLVYEVEFVVPSGNGYKEYDYEIDAYSAAVLSYDFDIEATYTPPAAAASATGSSVTISEASAKKKALAQVSGAAETNIVKFKLDQDDGRWEYEGEIVYNNMEYDFTIDANTGDIIEWDAESVYD